MKKGHKKLNRTFIHTLTEICEHLVDEISGFKYLTDFVDYDNIVETLNIVCVFENTADIVELKRQKKDLYIKQFIAKELLAFDVQIKKRDYVIFDSEEACNIEHGGDWTKRLKRFEIKAAVDRESSQSNWSKI